MARAQSVKSEIRRRLIQQDNQVRAELTAVVKQHTDILVRKYNAVVRDWTRRPYINPFMYVSKRLLIADITVSGKNAKYFIWTDKGTKAHIIQPKVASTLTFQTGYDARTQPVAKFNVGTGRRHGAWRRMKMVRHPGTKPRDFSKTFNQETSPAFRRDVENAIRRGLRRKKG